MGCASRIILVTQRGMLLVSTHTSLIYSSRLAEKKIREGKPHAPYPLNKLSARHYMHGLRHAVYDEPISDRNAQGRTLQSLTFVLCCRASITPEGIPVNMVLIGESRNYFRALVPGNTHCDGGNEEDSRCFSQKHGFFFILHGLSLSRHRCLALGREPRPYVLHGSKTPLIANSRAALSLAGTGYPPHSHTPAGYFSSDWIQISPRWDVLCFNGDRQRAGLRRLSQTVDSTPRQVPAISQVLDAPSSAH